MGLEFFLGAPAPVTRLAVLPGTFNPPTVAHLALARAALAEAGQVLFVLPRVFPHKRYEGASFEDRVAMLKAAAVGDPRLAVASSTGGLFVEIARECREAYGRRVRPAVVCGRDAAERIVNWDYGEAGDFAGMLKEFDILVAARGGEYAVPGGYADAISCLTLERDYTAVSATEVRERIRRREAWEHLVPPEVVALARQVYS